MNIRSKLMTGAAIVAAGAGGAGIANAASGSGSSSSTTASPPPAAQAGAPNPARSFHTVDGRSEQPLSGATAAKVRGAALAKVGGTVERVETNIDSSAPYEAHIRKADGSEVTVEVNRDFTVQAVRAMGMRP